jgi:hypothetical protein
LSAKIENLWKTYEAINELIRFADTKATAILAVDGVIAGFYFSNVNSIQTILVQKPFAILPLIMATAFLLISSIFAAYCIAPRLKMNKSNCLIFFCDIAKYKTADNYGKALENITNEKFEEQLINQIWANSKIATKKYNLVTISISIFVALLVSSLWFMLLAWR